MRLAIKLVSGFLALVTLLLLALFVKGYREYQHAQEVAAAFSPDIFSSEPSDLNTEALKKLSAECDASVAVAQEVPQHRDIYCRCMAVNTSHYVLPYIPESYGFFRRFLSFEKNYEEVAAKGLVISRLCLAKAVGQ